MKYVTVMDIARELGLSKSTVSRALSGDTSNVKEETMRLIVETAERMGYQRNEMAVNLRRSSTHTVGIIIPEIVTSFFMNFIQHAQQHLQEAGYKVMIAISNEDANQERDNLLMLEQCRVDGVLMSVCDKDANRKTYDRLIEHGTPVVFFDRTVEGIAASQVRMDDYIMSFFMVEELIRRGCRRIAHLAGPKRIRNGYDRWRGYRNALEKFHVDYDESLVAADALSAEEGSAAMERIIASGVDFDAVFGFTETAVLGAKTVLQKHGYRIPEDVALCCMSGTTLCTFVHPTITAVEQPVAEMAHVACELLLQKIKDPKADNSERVLRGEIVFRESTGE